MRDKARLVIDASVAAKWYLEKGEEDIAKAREVFSRYVRGEVELTAPEFFRYELPALIRNAVIKKRISPQRGARLVRDFQELNFPTTPGSGSEEAISQAYQAATRYNTSLYDALYLVLAEALGWKFLTSDAQLIRLLGDKVDYLLRLAEYKPQNGNDTGGG